MPEIVLFLINPLFKKKRDNMETVKSVKKVAAYFPTQVLIAVLAILLIIFLNCFNG